MAVKKPSSDDEDKKPAKKRKARKKKAVDKTSSSEEKPRRKKKKKDASAASSGQDEVATEFDIPAVKLSAPAAPAPGWSPPPPAYTPPLPAALTEPTRAGNFYALWGGMLLLFCLAFLGSCKERKLRVMESNIHQIKTSSSTSHLSDYHPTEEDLSLNSQKRWENLKIIKERYERKVYSSEHAQELGKLEAGYEVLRSSMNEWSAWAFYPRALGVFLIVWGLTSLLRYGAPKDRAVALAVLLLFFMVLMGSSTAPTDVKSRSLRHAPNKLRLMSDSGGRNDG